jgi:hypothetical protein
MIFLLVLDLYKSKREVLPTPEELMGGLVGRDHEEWPDYNDPDRSPWLREVDRYKNLLRDFTKEVLLFNEFRRGAHVKHLSEYMDATLEGFLVLVYVNNYEVWKMEAEKEMENNDSSSEDGSVSLLTENSATSRYTHKARGKGKFRGWTEEGIEMYNLIVEIVTMQRKDQTNEKTRDFERDLMRMFADLKRGGSGDGNIRPVKRARNSVSSALQHVRRNEVLSGNSLVSQQEHPV